MKLKKELNYNNKYININNYKLITTCKKTKQKKQKWYTPKTNHKMHKKCTAVHESYKFLKVLLKY